MLGFSPGGKRDTVPALSTIPRCGVAHAKVTDENALHRQAV